MKKLLIVVWIVITTGIFINAQNYALKAGYSIANVRSDFEGKNIVTENAKGIHFGAFYEYGINESFFINTGVTFLKKGYKLNVMIIEVNIPIHYLDFPVNLAYKIDLGALNLFAEAGPYAGIGLNGKVKGGIKNKNIEFGNGAGQIKRVDTGFNFGCGIEIKSFQICGNYQLGLVNIENSEGASTKHRIISISVGYVFGRDE